MDRYEATFEVDSRDEARAVGALLDDLYDTVREEAKTVSADRTERDEMLTAFRTLREAGRGEAPGRLTVVYERTADEFGE